MSVSPPTGLIRLIDDAFACWPEQVRRDLERRVCLLNEFRAVCLRVEDAEAVERADQIIRAAIADWKRAGALRDPEALRELLLTDPELEATS